MRNFLVTMKKFLRKSSIGKNKRKLMYSVNVCLVVCIFALLFIHLSGTAATEGFILKELYLQLGQLKATNKNLTLQSAEMQSIARIKDVAIEEFGMVESGGRDYIVLNQNKNIVKK